MIKDLVIIVLKSAFVVFSILAITAIALWALSSEVGFEPVFNTLMPTLASAALIKIIDG